MVQKNPAVAFGRRVAPRVQCAMKQLVALFMLLALAGCAADQMRNPVPPQLVKSAQVPGLAAARFWFDEKLPRPDQTLRQLGLKNMSSTQSVQGRPEVNYLALSGGADDGAYGAGLLVGWSQAGMRPTFDVVTGISAGALIAPFAFLGRDYDRKLRAMWFNHTTRFFDHRGQRVVGPLREKI